MEMKSVTAGNFTLHDGRRVPGPLINLMGCARPGQAIRGRIRAAAGSCAPPRSGRTSGRPGFWCVDQGQNAAGEAPDVHQRQLRSAVDLLEHVLA